MTGPIDVAYVEIEPDFSRFGSEVNSEIKAPLAALDTQVKAIIDAMEAQFNQLSSTIAAEFSDVKFEVGSSLSAIEGEVTGLTQAMESEFDVAIDTIENDFDRLRISADADLDRISAKSAETAGKMGAAFGALKAGASVAVAGLGAGLTALAGFGLKTAGTLEQVKIQFQSLTGSVEAGNKQFAELQQFAAATPFEFKDLTTAAARFDAFAGAIGRTQDQLIPFLTTIGNLVAETGGGAQQLNTISTALGQIASQGKLTLDNINQINDAIPGFNSVAAIASIRGETTAQVMNEISSGSIDAKDGINQLLEGMQKFPGAAGAMDKQSQTLLGVFSTFEDTFSQTLANSFTPVIPLIKDSLSQITPIIGDALKVLGPALGTLVSALLPAIGSLVRGIVPILVPILNALTNAFQILGPVLPIVGDALGRILSALEPLIPTLAHLIAEVVLALVPAVVQLAPELAELAPVFSDILEALIPLIPPLGQILVSIVELIAPFVHLLALWDAFATKNGLVPIVSALAEALGWLGEAIGSVADWLSSISWNDITNAVTSMATTIGGFFTGIYHTVVDFFTSLPGKIASVLAALPGLLVTLATNAFHAFFYAIGFGIGTIIKELLAFPGQVVAIFKMMWDGVVALFTQVIPAIVGFGLELQVKILRIFINLWDKAVALFKEGVDKLVAFARALPGRVIDWVKTLPDKIKGATSGSGNWLVDAGKNVIRGFIKGAEDMIGWAISKVKSAFHSIVDGAKDALGISSPSKVFAEIGTQSVAGYEQGLNKNSGSITAAMQQLVLPNGISTGGGQGMMFGPGAINVNFNGVVPTHAEAFATGQAVGQGISDAVARSRVANTVRTM